MQMLKQLWTRIVSFFSELSRPFLFIATCSVFLSFIIGSQIAHSVKELKYLKEIIVQERTIIEMNQELGWAGDVLIKQSEVISEQGEMLEFYKDSINDLIRQLKEKFEKDRKERPNHSEATNHERET